MMQISKAIFEKRFLLSQKYNTKFHEHMVVN